MQAAQRYLAAARNGHSNGGKSHGKDQSMLNPKQKASSHSSGSPFHHDIELNGLGKSESSFGSSKSSIKSNLNRSNQSIISTGDDDSESRAGSEPSFMEVLRRGSMGREESQNKLKETLHRYSDYEDPHDDSRIQQMKDAIQSSIHGRAPKPQSRFGRRSSLTSTGGSSHHRRTSNESESISRSHNYSGDVSVHSSYHRRPSIEPSSSFHRRNSMDSVGGGSLHRRPSINSTASLDVPKVLPRRALILLYMVLC